MSAIPAASSAPVVSSSDRLGMTLFLAIAAHAIVLLGVGFTFTPERAPSTSSHLEILLAKSRADEAPQETDYLAQYNQDGGGQSDTAERPSAPTSSLSPLDRQGLMPQQQEAMQAHAQELTLTRLITLQNAEQQVESRKDDPHQQQQGAQDRSQVGMQIARLQAEIREAMQQYAKRPKQITLTARTREAVEAAYMAQWVRRIERIGNLNYPPKARENGLRGQLRLNVTIQHDGRLLKVEVSRSSGEQILDQAAKQIVRLAQPYPAFPDKLRDKADQIVIVRSWEFDSEEAQIQSAD